MVLNKLQHGETVSAACTAYVAKGIQRKNLASGKDYKCQRASILDRGREQGVEAEERQKAV
jgi:hypothetical protein